jgi:hypothetical protein
MRTQECRESIDKAAEACDLSADAVRKVKQAAKFVEDHAGTCSQLATRAVLVLAKEKDKAVLDQAIATTEEKIKSGHRPTEQEVKQILSKVRGGSETPEKPPVAPKESPKEPEEEDLPAPKGGGALPLPEDQKEYQNLRANVGYVKLFTSSWLKVPCLQSIHPLITEFRQGVKERYPALWQ